MVWYDEHSAFGDITGVRGRRKSALVSVSRTLLHLDDYAELRGVLLAGRRGGKLTMQWAIRELNKRNPLTSMMRQPIPRVDTEKVRWRCAPPTAKRPQRGTFADLQERIGAAFSGGGIDSSFVENWMRDYDARYGTSTATPSVGHNVNVVTDRVPPHIAALPEEEQGPALVEAIFERKRRAQSD